MPRGPVGPDAAGLLCVAVGVVHGLGLTNATAGVTPAEILAVI